jgi:hypothetical protein
MQVHGHPGIKLGVVEVVHRLAERNSFVVRAGGGVTDEGAAQSARFDVARESQGSEKVTLDAGKFK